MPEPEVIASQTPTARMAKWLAKGADRQRDTAQP